MILNGEILEKKVEIKEVEEDLRVEDDQTHRMLAKDLWTCRPGEQRIRAFRCGIRLFEQGTSVVHSNTEVMLCTTFE
jgi:hypothetical protein